MIRIRVFPLMHAGKGVMFFVGMCLLCCHLHADGAAAGKSPVDCGRWTDSMIVAGKRCLDKNALDSARQFFTAAYHCGMSRDSMYYFAAELYLRGGAVDSAMTFNRALERSGRFDRHTYLEQRVRVFSAGGMKDKADSLAERISPWGKHEFRIDCSAFRSVLSINGLTLMPQRYTLHFSDNDTDDVGRAGVYYKWSRWNIPGLRKIMLTFNMFTDQKIPTRYSYDESNDTLMRSFAIGAGAGDYPGTFEMFCTYRARVHAVDGDIDHYLRGVATASCHKVIVSMQHETKLTDNGEIDDSRTEFSLFPPSVGRAAKVMFGLSGRYHFAKSDFYQTLLDTAGYFRPLRIGFVDSLVPKAFFHYYFDKNLTDAYLITRSDTLYDVNRDYWGKLRRMSPLKPLPEHDISASVRTIMSAKLYGGFISKTTAMIQATGYLTPVEWYAVDDPIHLFASDMDKSYGIVYNTADGKYYLHTRRSSLRYNPAEFRELKHYKKTRVDAVILLSQIIEKQVGTVGKFSFSVTYIKGFSTLDDNGPVARLNDLWQFSAGWSKEIVLVKQ